MRPIAARYDRAANRVATPASGHDVNGIAPTECRRQTSRVTTSHS